MKKMVLAGIFLFAGLGALAYGAEKRKIDLTDGSVIEAEVQSLSNGVYDVRSDTLGAMKIESSKVRKIESVGAPIASPISGRSVASPASEAPDLATKAAQIKDEMTNNPEIMKIINGLISDPNFQAASQDPEIVKAAQSGDVQALTSNKKFMSLLSDPKVGEIKGKLKE